MSDKVWEQWRTRALESEEKVKKLEKEIEELNKPKDIEPTVNIIREVINKTSSYEQTRCTLHEAFVATNSPVIKALRNNYEEEQKKQWSRIRPALNELLGEETNDEDEHTE